MRKSWIVLSLLLATGCVSPVTWVGVPVVAETVLPGQFSVKGQAGWNRLDEGGKVDRDLWWTVNGAPLDLVRFFTGLAPGQPMIQVKGQAAQKRMPTFQAKMQPEEIVEMYEALVTSDGNTFKRDKLAPCAFAGGDGFRFEFTLVRKSDEVTLKGAGWGVVRNDKLYLMVFQAARIHYYPDLLPKVEAMAASARIGA